MEKKKVNGELHCFLYMTKEKNSQEMKVSILWLSRNLQLWEKKNKSAKGVDRRETIHSEFSIWG
jgi:hypothetical protein